MDRLDDISVFVHIIDQGGISAAAHRLRVSKSAVSRRLSTLEARLGVELIARTTRSQKLTEEGQVFYERCVRILADLDEAEADVTRSRGTLSGTLRLTAPLYFGQHHLAPLVAEFMGQHVDLTIDLDLSDHHANLIEEGFDLAIRIGRLHDSTLRTRKLLPVALYACASPAYLETFGVPGDITALYEHRGLLHRSGSVPSGWTYESDTGASMRARIRPSLISNNDALLLEATKRGQGIVCMPDFIVEEALCSGELVRILRDVDWQGASVQAVYPQARHLSSRVRHFIDFLAARLGRQT